MSSTILDSSFTVGWVVEQLVDYCGERVELADWQVERIGEGKGFASNIARLSLKWATPVDKLPKSVVLKIPTLASTRQQMDRMPNIDAETKESILKDAHGIVAMKHNNEVVAYNWLQKHRTDIMRIPTVYGAEKMTTDEMGIVIMEDFHDRGLNISICDGLNMQQVYTLVDSVAAWQAKSLTHTEWVGEMQTKVDPKSMKKLSSYIDGLKNKLLELRPEYGARLDKLFQGIGPDSMQEARISHEKLGMLPVLVQGDMWTNNFMFDKQSPNTLLAVLDWQPSHPGNCMEDISRLLVSSVDGKIRREHTENVIQIYYNRLQEYMGQKAPFSLEDVHRAYDDILVHTAKLFVMGLGMMCDSPVVEGPNKAQNIANLLIRGDLIMDDLFGSSS